MPRIFTSINDLEDAEIRGLYDAFNAPIAALDCGHKCAPHNPSGKPFCCDICHAVPAAYHSEWSYLEPRTDLWHVWRGDECGKADPVDRLRLQQSVPEGMVLLACLGPDRCQRRFRALSCRQFPFFPYVTSDYVFLGLTCEWEFENTCWVISNLNEVTARYREEFVRTFDRLFALFQDEFESYAAHSRQLREYYQASGRRFPLLHRDGGAYLVSPGSERKRRVNPAALPKFGFYRE